MTGLPTEPYEEVNVAERATARSRTPRARLTEKDLRYLRILAEELRAAEAKEDLSRQEIRAMVYRLVSAGRLQKQAGEIADHLVSSLTPIVDPVPAATFAQVRRRVERRRQLLETGTYTIATVAAAKGSSPAAIRQWIARGRRANRIFTVLRNGQTLIPAVVLDGEFEPRSEMAEATSILKGVGLDGWALWDWWSRPNSWLDGKAPLSVLTMRPDKVTEAARRWASNVG